MGGTRDRHQTGRPTRDQKSSTRDYQQHKSLRESPPTHESKQRGEPSSNLQPSVCLNWCAATFGKRRVRGRHGVCSEHDSVQNQWPYSQKRHHLRRLHDGSSVSCGLSIQPMGNALDSVHPPSKRLSSHIYILDYSHGVSRRGVFTCDKPYTHRHLSMVR